MWDFKHLNPPNDTDLHLKTLMIHNINQILTLMIT